MWQVSGAGGSDGNDAGGVAGAADYERAIGERDARIAELEAWVAEAAMTYSFFRTFENRIAA